ncbi:MAG: hypothetical protein CVV24_03145 [Ignavibacteriae bacterium HGW-Ignavibacteriae-3]|nr:MAG: hypothetical protein CVV24_03145 [Ignavibacteriae bacterium HGW-Ignavibacteriae-3]
MILTKEHIRSINFDELTDQKNKDNKLGELLIIVPTNRKVRHLKKEIISNNDLNAASDLNIETIGTISTKLLQYAEPFNSLSEAAATLFIKQSAQEIKLRYLSTYKEEIPFGTLDRIKSVISEYKRHGITPEKLKEEGEKLEGSERLKALDIAEIYEIYRNKCFNLKAYEIGDIYEKLNSLQTKDFVGIFKSLFPGVNLIILDGFSEFSNPEVEIIEKLSSVGNSKLYIRFDYGTENKMIFSHIAKCYGQLTQLGYNKIEGISSEGNETFKRNLQEKLFQSKKDSVQIDEKERIMKISAHSRESEVEVISMEIKKLILEKNIEPHKIGVAFNLIQNYSSIIKDIFNKNGIPVNLTDRTPLDNSNPVTAIVNYLEIVENDFYFKNVFRALSGKFIDTGEIDVSNLYRVASELKIVSGKENWISILEDFISISGGSGDEYDESESKKSSYVKALDDIKAISNLLKPFERAINISEFQEHLNEFVIRSKIPYRLLEIKIDEEKNIRAFTDFIDTTREIFELLKKEHGPDKKFPIDFYMDQIRTACNWARFNVKEKSNYGVQVTSLEEIRGLKFDYLFLSGLCEGDFPTRYQPEIFVSGTFKKQAQYHQYEERYRFYQSLCCWNKKLFLTYPDSEGGRETVVSTFLKEFEELFTIRSKGETDYNDSIFSKEGLQIFIGKNGLEHSPNYLDDETIDMERISKSLSVEKIRRSDPYAESPFAGILLAEKNNSKESDGIAEKLKTFSQKQYSISQLETYAKCPFKFFLERIIGVKTIDEPSEDIEAVEMGRILHTIFYEFYSAIRDKEIGLAGCSEKDFKEYEKLIFRIADEQLKSAAFKSPLTFYEKEKILGLMGDKKESVLYRFLESERKGDKDFIPKYFEVSFGRVRPEESDKIISDQEPILIDGIKLRGKIDRVDVNDKNKSFDIVDYKLGGSKPSFNDLKTGISLQLPVYMYAARELLAKKMKKNYSPNEMFIYSLKYSSDEFGKKNVRAKGGKDDEIQNIEQLIEVSIEHIKTYISSISEGKYHLSKLEERENKVCRFCEFRTVCRIDDKGN